MQPNLQTTTTPEEAASLADSGRRGVIVSTVAAQTPLKTCAGWLAAIRTHSCHHDWKRSNLCSNLVLYDTRGANESWNMSRRESYRAQRWQLPVSFFGGRSPLLPTCLHAQNAPATMQAMLDLTCFTHDCSADVYCQVGAGTVVESPLRG